MDNYLSKRAWGTEGAFSSFNSVMLGWIGETKRIYEAKLFNTFIGTNTADGTAQNITLTATPSDLEGEAAFRYEAQNIARTMADLYVALADAGRDYNDLGNYRSFAKGDMVVVWNSEHVNKITKLDLPTVFHKDLDLTFKHVLPAKYFGTVKTVGATIPSGSTNTTIRSLVEADYNTVAPSHENYVKSLHIFPGDLIPAGQSYEAYEAYEEDPTVICKVYHKNAVPFMSAFEVGTSFFNAKSLTENRYLTWGYNTLENLANYPFITIKAPVA